MEIQLLTSIFFSFIAFIILHVVIFRRISRRQVLTWMVAVFAIAGIFTMGVSYYFVALYPFTMLLFFYFVFWMLYGLLSLIYFLAIFGIIESSIRIRLLAEVVKSGKTGITPAALYRIYNRESIVKKRLERFVASGDIVYDGNKYRMSGKLSAFSFPGAIFSLLWKMYRG